MSLATDISKRIFCRLVAWAVGQWIPVALTFCWNACQVDDKISDLTPKNISRTKFQAISSILVAIDYTQASEICCGFQSRWAICITNDLSVIIVDDWWRNDICPGREINLGSVSIRWYIWKEPNTTAGVRVEDWQVPGPHLLPEEMARLIAAVSSVTPSPIQ